MRNLFKYFSTVKKDLIITPILILFEVFFEILIPVYMKKMIDEGIGEGVGLQNPTLVYQYGAMMIVFALIALVFGIMVTKTSAKVATEFSMNLRQAQFEKIQEYSFENIDKFKTSSLITRMTMDVNMIQMATNMMLRVTFRAPSMIIFSIVSISLFAPKLITVFLIALPILIIGFFVIMKGSHRHFVKMFSKLDNLNLTIQEDLIGIRTVKSFVREDYEVDRFTDATMEVRNNSIKAEKWIIFNSPLMSFAIGLSFVLVGWLGSNLMVGGTLTKGEFANTITYINQVLFSLMMISQVFLMLVMSKEPIRRINEVLNEKPLLVEKEDPINYMRDGSFRFDNVSFKYGLSSDKYVLDNINLNIKSGSFVGIFGATGTGKTTLVQLLARLYDVNKGTIYVGGEDIRDYSIETLRANINLVLQKNVLFSGTIRDNVKWGNEDATDEEIIEVLKKSEAYEFVSKMEKGLDTWIEQGGVNVSGGQRQRLTIARALISKPKILILDDSTSAVDTKTDSKIRYALNVESPEMTKVVISQRLTSIEDADVIILMDESGIQSMGTHDELYKNNKMYKDIYDTQARGREVLE